MVEIMGLTADIWSIEQYWAFQEMGCGGIRIGGNAEIGFWYDFYILYFEFY